MSGRALLDGANTAQSWNQQQVGLGGAAQSAPESSADLAERVARRHELLSQECALLLKRLGEAETERDALGSMLDGYARFTAQQKRDPQ